MNWISVSEKKPEMFRSVIFCSRNAVHFGWLENEYPEDLSWVSQTQLFPEDENSDIFPEEVTHWMDPPQPVREYLC